MFFDFPTRIFLLAPFRKRVRKTFSNRLFIKRFMATAPGTLPGKALKAEGDRVQVIRKEVKRSHCDSMEI